MMDFIHSILSPLIAEVSSHWSHIWEMVLLFPLLGETPTAPGTYVNPDDPDHITIVHEDGSTTTTPNRDLDHGTTGTSTGSGGDLVYNADTNSWGYPAAESPDYSEYFASMEESLDAQMALAERQMQIAEDQARMADLQFDFYKENYLPVINDLIAEANTGIDPNYSAQLAGERVGLSYDAAQGAQDRNLERTGINPQDALYEGMDDTMARDKTAAVVGARNNARLGAIDTNQARQMEVASMGAGVPVNASGALTASANSVAGAASSTALGYQGMATAQQQQIAAQQMAASTQNTATYTQAQFNQNAAYANSMAQAQAQAQMYGAMGTLAGAGLAYGMSGSSTPSATSQVSNTLTPMYGGSASTIGTGSTPYMSPGLTGANYYQPDPSGAFTLNP